MKLQICEHGSARLAWHPLANYSFKVHCYAVFVEDAGTKDMIPFIVATKNEGIIERLETATGLNFEKPNTFDWSLLSDTDYATVNEFATEDRVIGQIAHEIAQMQFDHYNELIILHENPYYSGSDCRLDISDEISPEMETLVNKSYADIEDSIESEYRGWYYNDNGDFQLYQGDE